MNDDETVSWKTEGFDWSVGKGKWTFTGKEVKFDLDGKDYSVKKDEKTDKWVDTAKVPTFTMDDHKSTHVIR